MTEGTLLAGRYRLEARLGADPREEVWRASDTVLDRRVAVRIATGDGEEPGAFHARATRAGSLNHRHAVTIYDVGEVDRRPFLVTELIEGVPLPRLLREGPAGAAVAALIGRDTAAALGSAHRREVVHGDLRPAAVLLSVAGEAKLVGLGLSGTGRSTPRWTAPELRSDEPGGRPATVRGDVYALGLVLHTCLTGWRPPVGGAGEGTIPELSSHRPDVPARLAEVIATATSTDPSDRHRDGEELAAALAELVPPSARDQLAATVRPLTDARPAPDGPTTGPRQPAGDRPGPSGAAPTRVIERAEPTAAGDDTATLPTAPGVGPWWRRHGPGVGVAVVGLALVAVLGGALLGGGGTDPGPDEATRSDPTATAPTGPVRLVSATDFDPFADGGSEHPEETGRAIDGDPSTAWSTEHYNTAALGGLKPGVGLWVELESEADPARIELEVPGGSVDLELFLGPEPPSGTDPAGWGERIATHEDASGRVVVESSGDVSGRYLLIWFTDLAPEDGRFAARLAEVRVLGPPDQ